MQGDFHGILRGFSPIAFIVRMKPADLSAPLMLSNKLSAGICRVKQEAGNIFCFDV